MLTVLRRHTWRPAPRRCAPDRRPASSIDTVVIHWPGEERSLQFIDTVAEEHHQLRNWQTFHIAVRGWCDIGYNHVMFPNWERSATPPHVYAARGAHYTPAAQEGHNTGTLALMVALGEGDPLTEDVKRRIRSYIRWAEEYAGHSLRVRTHTSFGGTECPGPALTQYVNSIHI